MTNQDCILGRTDPQQSESDAREKKLFVISPFGYPYDDIYRKVIETAANRAHIKSQRADLAFQLGFVMCQKICKLMQEADYVLADVTEENPNVYYELGLAWGFGKKILIVRDTDADPTPGFGQILGCFASAGKILPYAELLQLESNECHQDKFVEILETRSIDVQQSYAMDVMRRQEAYISEKNISFCFQKGLPDKKFYLRVVGEAAKQVDTTSHWTVNSVPIAEGFLEALSSEQMKHLSSSKVFIVDVTHYDEKANVAIYFVLGLSHSLGRQTIPITNRSKCGAPPPFDVRGLWQIHFNSLETLSRGLAGILTEIDKDYENERRDYPLTFIWDKVLKPPARLTVLTCARAAAADKNRPGGRTNVDKWDYTSVGELSAFLASKYRDAHITIAPPEEKVTQGLDSDDGKEDLARETEAKIQRIHNSVIIIGSPDVSDYAEIVLARAYGITPYKPQECEQTDAGKKRKCWDCIELTDCVGKRGYLYYKETESSHPREVSCFFHKPPKGEKECVVWYGQQFECTHAMRGSNPAEGSTFGVLTIMKERPEFFGMDKRGSTSVNKWIIVLSGFTGIGTYGLAKLLTTLDFQAESDGTKKGLQEILRQRSLDLETQGVQVLVSVRYKSGANAKKHDSRDLDECAIVAVKPFFTERALSAKGGTLGDGKDEFSAPVSHSAQTHTRTKRGKRR